MLPLVVHQNYRTCTRYPGLPGIISPGPPLDSAVVRGAAVFALRAFKLAKQGSQRRAGRFKAPLFGEQLPMEISQVYCAS